MYKIKRRVKLSLCNEDMCGSGGPTPRVIQLKLCANFDAPCQFTQAWMLRVQTELEAEWAPEPGWSLWGRKISLAVPGDRTAHYPGFDLARRVIVCVRGGRVWKGHLFQMCFEEEMEPGTPTYSFSRLYPTSIYQKMWTSGKWQWQVE